MNNQMWTTTATTQRHSTATHLNDALETGNLAFQVHFVVARLVEQLGGLVKALACLPQFGP